MGKLEMKYFVLKLKQQINVQELIDNLHDYEDSITGKILAEILIDCLIESS